MAALIMGVCIFAISMGLGQAIAFHKNDRDATASSLILQSLGDRLLAAPESAPLLAANSGHIEYFDHAGNSLQLDSTYSAFKATWNVNKDTPIRGVTMIDLEIHKMNDSNGPVLTTRLYR